MNSYLERIEQAFPRMAAILKPCESEHFAILHFTVTEEEVRMCQMIDRIHGRREYYGFKAGEYVRLCLKPVTDDTMMSDTFMEKMSNYDFVQDAHGDVLIAGLGIGMVLLAVQDLSSVSSVTVVEIEQEVIDLVKQQLPLNQKVSIVQGDIFTFETTAKFDTIYFDIWDSICGYNWEGMKKLQRRFRSKLKKGGWMGCWRKEDCRERARS